MQSRPEVLCSVRNLPGVTHKRHWGRYIPILLELSGGATMTNGHWQLEGSAAELYQRCLVPQITMKWAEDLVDRALPRAGEAILDIACGTGVVARLTAKRVAQGQITGLDLNAGMLAVARSVPNDGAPINWIEGSALDLPFPSD